MGKIYKQALYDFLEMREREVIKEKITPLDEKIDELKEKLYERKLNEHGVDLKALHKSAKMTLNLLDSVIESVGAMTWDLQTYTRELKDLMEDDFKHEVLRNINDGELDKLIQDRERLRNDIKVEYAKLNAIVKSKSNGVKGYEYLKDMGFDVSKVSIVDEYQMEVLNVNKDLLGL